MRPSSSIRFGSWSPDLPALDLDPRNYGRLTEAQNVIFYDGAYRPFPPLGSSGTDALSLEPENGYIDSQDSFIYVGLRVVGAAHGLYRAATSGGAWTDVSPGNHNSGIWTFTKFGDHVIATNGVDAPQKNTGSGNFSTLAASGTAPTARIVGRIGQFLFFGHTGTVSPSGENYVHWSAIGDATNWPTPGSADAAAVQSGVEPLNSAWGPVVAIKGGDQFGIVIQRGGVTRVTYIGGEQVFQFDQIENSKGTPFLKSVVSFGRFWYYISGSGEIYQTDGVTCEPISTDKVTRYFITTYAGALGTPDRTFGAVDPRRRLIFWCYKAASENNATRILTYHIDSGHFTHCEQDLNCLLGYDGDLAAIGDTLPFWAFTTSHAGRQFDGTPGTAVITTSEVELNPGGRTHVEGVKPFVTLKAGVTPTITVALGTRDDQDDDSVSYTSESTPHSRTGFAGFRSDARYHRSRVTITGDFKDATGIQFQASPSGSA